MFEHNIEHNSSSRSSLQHNIIYKAKPRSQNFQSSIHTECYMMFNNVAKLILLLLVWFGVHHRKVSLIIACVMSCLFICCVFFPPKYESPPSISSHPIIYVVFFFSQIGVAAIPTPCLDFFQMIENSMSGGSIMMNAETVTNDMNRVLYKIIDDIIEKAKKDIDFIPDKTNLRHYQNALDELGIRIRRRFMKTLYDSKKDIKFITNISNIPSGIATIAGKLYHSTRTVKELLESYHKTITEHVEICEQSFVMVQSLVEYARDYPTNNYRKDDDFQFVNPLDLALNVNPIGTSKLGDHLAVVGRIEHLKFHILKRHWHYEINYRITHTNDDALSFVYAKVTTARGKHGFILNNLKQEVNTKVPAMPYH